MNIALEKVAHSFIHNSINQFKQTKQLILRIICNVQYTERERETKKEREREREREREVDMTWVKH